MYELIQAGERTYYVDSPSKVGICRMEGNEVCLIDSGSDKDGAKKVLRHLETRGWKASRLLCTHSHADHTGGAALLRQRTGCRVFVPGVDLDFTRHPVLEPSFLYGGYPAKALRNKFLMAQPCDAEELTEHVLPEGLELLRIDGHSFSMVAFRTGDDVWFLADSVASEAVLKKYHIPFVYDVEGYLRGLDQVERLSGRLFVPSHAPAAGDIRPLVQSNRAKVVEILKAVEELCIHGASFEEVLKGLFDRYGLAMDWNQYVLVGSTVRSCLSFLLDRGVLETRFADNRLVWRTAEK
ncbi:MBL fold metallo-hydrolase [Oscillibacter sp. MSJ-2]|uniref:beta-lactamase n=1 Tax=Dysosmobacter acutus TaxID=2841504 RepID=A0ABS6F6S3_9FIRM|nr:MBL fold metallo-hydrolase [Dysosmobacter acutus]